MTINLHSVSSGNDKTVKVSKLINFLSCRMPRDHHSPHSSINDRIATQRYVTNDRIATQRYLTPEIPKKKKRRPRLAVPLANLATGVLERWLLTLLDAAVFVHFAIVIPALHSRLSYRNQIWHTYLDGYGTDSNLNNVDPPDPRGVSGGILAGQKFKSPGNVMNCPENQ